MTSTKVLYYQDYRICKTCWAVIFPMSESLHKRSNPDNNLANETLEKNPNCVWPLTQQNWTETGLNIYVYVKPQFIFHLSNWLNKIETNFDLYFFFLLPVSFGEDLKINQIGVFSRSTRLFFIFLFGQCNRETGCISKRSLLPFSISLGCTRGTVPKINYVLQYD